jgi:hypothetical protein
VVISDRLNFFSQTDQRSFDAAQVDGDSEALFHAPRQVACAQVWLGLQGFLDKDQHIGG